jgi:hypothetical protein
MVGRGHALATMPLFDLSLGFLGYPRVVLKSSASLLPHALLGMARHRWHRSVCFGRLFFTHISRANLTLLPCVRASVVIAFSPRLRSSGPLFHSLGLSGVILSFSHRPTW